jgi:hypothetical protein
MPAGDSSDDDTDGEVWKFRYGEARILPVTVDVTVAGGDTEVGWLSFVQDPAIAEFVPV